MDAGEALEAEPVGAVCTVPHACFLHRTPPALPVVRPSAGLFVGPYIQPHCLCQGREFRNPNRLTAPAFQRCGAARTFGELARFQSRIWTSAAVRLFG